MLLGVALVAHVVCFAVLTMEVDRRYQNAESVSQIAELLAASQQVTLRAYFMQVGEESTAALYGQRWWC